MAKGPRKASKSKAEDEGLRTAGSVKKPPGVCIIPNFLYLGPVSAASNPAFLSSQEISHIISIGKSPSHKLDVAINTPNGEKQLTYYRLSLIDTPESDITSCVIEACKIIDAAAASGEKVLIHCSAAISRSPTIVAAYLMKSRGYTLRKSLQILVAAREAIAPNPGFLAQLRELEASIFDGKTTFDVDISGAKVRLATYLASSAGGEVAL